MRVTGPRNQYTARHPAPELALEWGGGLHRARPVRLRFGRRVALVLLWALLTVAVLLPLACACRSVYPPPPPAPVAPGR